MKTPSMTLVEKATTVTTPYASHSATTSPSGSPAGPSRNSRSEWPNTMGPTIARHAATQDGLVTTPSPPSANPLNTQTVSSPSRIRPLKTLTPESPNWFNPRKTRTPAIPNLVNPTALKTLPLLSFLSAAKNLPRLRRRPGNQPRIPTPARPQTTRRPMARANVETPATSEYRSATCCQCQPAPYNRASHPSGTPLPPVSLERSEESRACHSAGNAKIWSP